MSNRSRWGSLSLFRFQANTSPKPWTLRFRSGLAARLGKKKLMCYRNDERTPFRQILAAKWKHIAIGEASSICSAEADV